MNEKQRFLILTLLLLLSTMACRERISSGEQMITTEATSAATAVAAATPADSGNSLPTLSPGSTLTPPIAETAPPPARDPGRADSDASTLDEPPAGLLMALGSMGEGWDLVVAGEGGQLRTLVEQIALPHYLPDFAVSPDGHRILYASDGDIWLLDVASGASANVTSTPERREQVPRWLPGRAGFVCGSTPESPEIEHPHIGYLTLVHFDGHYEILVAEGTLAAPAAPAPDGESIAYSRSHQRQPLPFLYRIGSGETRVDLEKRDLDWVQTLWEASWSPDGQQLAWSVAGEREGEWVAAEILLNLADGTHTLLHSYRPLAMGGYIPAPVWAQDGSWLIFEALDEQPGGWGIWRVDLQSGLKEQLSPQCLHPSLVRQPALAPDGDWIAAPPCGAVGDIRLINMGSAAATWVAPAEVAAVGWVDTAALLGLTISD